MPTIGVTMATSPSIRHRYENGSEAPHPSFPRKRESRGGGGAPQRSSLPQPLLDSRLRGNDGFRASVPCVADVLRRATARLQEAGSDTPGLDAELLLMEALGWSREDLYRSPEVELQDPQIARFEGFVGRRGRGEPVAYVTGSREFWSLEFRVTRDVLIPRPETEHLVETVLDFLASRPGRCRILEVGTGSGAIAVSLAKERERAEVWAADVSAPALEVARENARRHGVERRIHWLRGDLLAPAQGLPGCFDVVVSNPPYIPSGELAGLQRDVRDWEPALALDGGIDGMDFYRRIVRDGVRHLRDGGLMAVEIGADLSRGVSELFRTHAELRRVRILSDYSGRPRVVAAERAPVGAGFKPARARYHARTGDAAPGV